MKAKLIRDMPKLVRVNKDGKTVMRRIADGIRSGTVIDHPKAYFLVKQGVAEPADAECATAAGMTPETFEAAKKAYDKVSKGIHPEDYEAYEQGLMVGYKPDGQRDDSWLPGPKWTAGCEADYYESKQEEDQDE